ncbi:MAG: asparagine synthase (glutamine-hydrolyzing) [Planctomycetes bacterium]|nr:asparagine synthase (glutamine-hydrolyzing) [Planctomycetota bacterium]
MCGIAGLIGPGHKTSTRADTVASMLDVMAHRGPDGRGVVEDDGAVLGHCRLAIIDLVTGDQPMRSRDERLVMTFNGEIYNYLELRQELIQQGYAFATSSDTEVLLYLYDCYGPECVHRLNGMFAFAIWDRKERRLFAARDRFGIKPFYWVQLGDAFAFASEIKAFRCVAGYQPRPDPDGLAEYLRFQFCLGDRTLFMGVHRLEPGHTLEVEPAGRPSIKRYWDLRFDIDTHHTEAYFIDRVKVLLGDSVRFQLRSDVPIGAYLSGGMDSSAIASLAGDFLGGRISTFTGGFREGPTFDETSYARSVAKRIGSNHFEVFPTAADFERDIARLIWFMDEPAAGPGLFPQYQVARLARDHVKVILGGQGGDEVFGGYARYLACYLEECLLGAIEETTDPSRHILSMSSMVPALPTLRHYKPMLQHFWRDGLFEPLDRRYLRLVDRGTAIQELYQPDFLTGYDPTEAFREIFNRPGIESLFNRMTFFDMRTLLPALLHVEDRVSMAVSLESRVPLLDHRIAELVMTVPPAWKFKDGRLKHLLRRAVEHILPEEVLKRQDKMGFPVPLVQWTAGPLRDFFRDTLLGREARERGIYRVDAVERLLDHESPFGRDLWGLLCLELWYRTLDGRSTRCP